MKYRKVYDEATKAWRTEATPTTERVWDAASGTWSQRAIQAPTKEVEAPTKEVKAAKVTSKKRKK